MKGMASSNGNPIIKQCLSGKMKSFRFGCLVKVEFQGGHVFQTSFWRGAI